MTNERGFSLVEMLVSVTIMMAVTGGIFAVMNPAHGTFQTQPGPEGGTIAVWRVPAR